MPKNYIRGGITARGPRVLLGAQKPQLTRAPRHVPAPTGGAARQLAPPEPKIATAQEVKRAAKPAAETTAKPKGSRRRGGLIEVTGDIDKMTDEEILKQGE